MNRTTRYYKGYGYVTNQNKVNEERIVNGNGIFDNIVKGITSVISSNRTKDVLTEGAKAIAKSAGDKAGSKIVDKITKFHYSVASSNFRISWFSGS